MPPLTPQCYVFVANMRRQAEISEVIEDLKQFWLELEAARLEFALCTNWTGYDELADRCDQMKARLQQFLKDQTLA